MVKRVASSHGTILLATDFSEPARRVVPYALVLASSFHLGLTLLHVVKAPPGSEDWSPARRRSIDSLKTGALLELARVARLAQEKKVAVDHRLVVGVPADAILKAAEDADAKLIAVGTNGRTGMNRLRLGSVAETILLKASCPVLTGCMAGKTSSPVKPIRGDASRLLVAVDFSASSRAAFQFAVTLAKRLHTKLVMVHVAEPSDPSQPKSVQGDESSRRRIDRRFERLISTCRADQLVGGRIVLRGDPVDAILDQAKRMSAGGVVMGTNGRRGMKLLLLGSVARSVVRKAACPVLVVKAGSSRRRNG
ncbi:MAG: putative Universal stress protein [Nitrospira sp.]